MAEARNGTPKHQTITFQGRQLSVSAPTADQLAVWQRTARRMAAVDVDALDGGEAMKLLDRGVRVIESVLPVQDDRDWLEDQLLDGVLTLEQAAKIVTDAITAFGNGNGRAPKVGPVKRARRSAR